jgi:hypothetical protein
LLFFDFVYSLRVVSLHHAQYYSIGLCDLFLAFDLQLLLLRLHPCCFRGIVVWFIAFFLFGRNDYFLAL